MKAIVIGGGIAGMACAAKLRGRGYQVELVERHDRLGGRGRTWETQGYTFDMGPSWYLMPEVFDQFFDSLGKKREDYYSLNKLDPYYRVFFEKEGTVDIGGSLDDIAEVFDTFESDGGEILRRYVDTASYKYKVALEDFLYKEYRSLFQFLNPKLMFRGAKLGVFGSLHKHVQKFFSSRKAQKILEYAMVFLGNSPSNAPALYSIMSHVDLVQGVFFPDGGMGSFVDGMGRLLEEMGVVVRLNSDVSEILVEGKRTTGVRCGEQVYEADLVIATGDYHHIEQDLLHPDYRNYSRNYWQTRTVAPSMYIMYLGVKKKLEGLRHHNLYFADAWEKHFDQIFDDPQWPDNPSYYVSMTSYDDDSMSPADSENIFILVPVAPGLEAKKDFLENYGNKIIRHLEGLIGQDFRSDIDVMRIYTGEDFIRDYSAFKGTALGLAHTLNQTAVFRPSMRNRKLKNLFYAGQYTHPGVGVPMTLIAADIIADVVPSPK